LKKLAEFRNRCAHSFPDATDKYLARKETDRIRLVWYEGGIRKHENVTYADATAKVREYVRVLVDVSTIQEKLSSIDILHMYSTGKACPADAAPLADAPSMQQNP
jgi:hypothetical protein